MSELAAQLTSSPAVRGSELNLPRASSGSVVSEIDLIFPLNNGTHGLVGSSTKTPRTSVCGTPIRISSDIQSDKRLSTVSLSQPDGAAVPSFAGDGLPQFEVVPPREASETTQTMVIRDDSVLPYKAKIKKFVETWVDPQPDVDEVDKNGPTYMQQLKVIVTLENSFLDVNCSHIQNFDADLYRLLVCYPQEVIPTFDIVVNEIFFETFPNTTPTHQIQVRPYSADKTKNMRTLGPDDFNQLITITGIVTHNSDQISEMDGEAVFRCSVCRYTVTSELERGRINKPTLCHHCSTNHSFSQVQNRRFSGKHMMKLQESLNEIPAGQTPHNVILNVHGVQMYAVQPGNRVLVTGVYRNVPTHVSSVVGNIKSVNKTHIDVVHFSKTDDSRLQGKEEKKKPEPWKIAEIEELSKKPDIYEAHAPSIYENEDIEKGNLLQVDCLHSKMEKTTRDLEVWSYADIINLWKKDTELIDMTKTSHLDFATLAANEALDFKKVPYTQVCAIKYEKKDIFGVQFKIGNFDNPWVRVSLRKLLRKRKDLSQNNITSFPLPKEVEVKEVKLSKAKINAFKYYSTLMYGKNKAWIENIINKCG